MSHNYNVKKTASAEKDIRDAIDYLIHKLSNKKAARVLFDSINKAVSKIKSYPEMCPTVSDPLLAAWGIRFIAVGNHLIFYIVSHSSKTIYIVRVLYNRRNWSAILKAGIDPGRFVSDQALSYDKPK